MYPFHSGRRSASIHLVKIAVNGTDAPVIVEDPGQIIAKDGHVRDSAGNYTIQMRRSHVTIDGFAVVDGDDADMAKVRPVTSAAKEFELVTIEDAAPHAVGDLTSKTVSVWLYISRSQQTMI